MRPRKDARVFLQDIIRVIESVEKALAAKTLADYEDEMVKWSAERSLSVIGEALWQASKLQANLPITSLSQIIGMRHILVHDYDLIDAARLYSIIQKYLPVLKAEVQAILTQMNAEN